MAPANDRKQNPGTHKTEGGTARQAKQVELQLDLSSEG
jgi:hypothetical protein